MVSTYIDRGLLGSRIAAVNFESGVGRFWFPRSSPANAVISVTVNGPAASGETVHIAAATPFFTSVLQREVVTNAEFEFLKWYELQTITILRRHPSAVTCINPSGTLQFPVMEQGPTGELIHGGWIKSGFPVEGLLVQFDSATGVELDRVSYFTSIPDQTGTPFIKGIASHGDQMFVVWLDKQAQVGPDQTFTLYLDTYSRATPLVRTNRVSIWTGTKTSTPFAGIGIARGSSSETPSGKRINVLVSDAGLGLHEVRSYTTGSVRAFDTGPTVIAGINPWSIKSGLEPLPETEEVTGTRWLFQPPGSPTMSAYQGTTNIRTWTYAPLGAFSYWAVSGF